MMMAQGSGAVVNVSGETGIAVLPSPFRSTCTGPSKAAQNRLTKILASELGEFGIRVNSVVPGFVHIEEKVQRWEQAVRSAHPDDEDLGDRHDWGRSIARPGHEWGSVEEIVNAIVFLASDRASFVVGAALVVDGGQDKS